MSYKSKRKIGEGGNSELRGLVEESIKNGKTTVNEMKELLINVENEFTQ